MVVGKIGQRLPLVDENPVVKGRIELEMFKFIRVRGQLETRKPDRGGRQDGSLRSTGIDKGPWQWRRACERR